MDELENLQYELKKWIAKRDLALDTLNDAKRRFEIYDEAVKSIQSQIDKLN